jgi:methylated-DNA-[protein]-cysteine S-methyltransferase
MTESVFYKSPLGAIQLKAQGNILSSALFVSSHKSGISKERQDLDYEVPTSPILVKSIEQLDLYFSGSELCFNLAHHQTGTDFQQKVWNALMHVRPGNTMSYLQLSNLIGDSKAVRAVGMANGKNSIAIIVPCHRIIGSKGHLTGYAGDLWRKQWLLEHEAKYLNGVQTLFA